MFANDYEWITYGGMVPLTDAFPDQTANTIAAYEKYDNRDAPQFSSGYVIKDLPDDITRYIADGAAVSAPSENLGFYFSGLKAVSGGPISYSVSKRNASLNADQVSNTLIKVDMAKEKDEKW